MTRALVWKEVREQWAVWLAVAVAAAGSMGTLVAVQSPGFDRSAVLVTLLWCAAWGYGVICGSLLLAGEAEDDTQTFLDTLPATRNRLWRVKAATGLGLLAAQMAAYLALASIFASSGYLSARLLTDVPGLLYLGGLGLAWGLFCGSFSANVLRAVGWAVLLQLTCAITLFAVESLALQELRPQLPYSGTVFLVLMGALGVAVAARSRTVYCRNDQMRESAAAPRGQEPVQRGWEVLVWLAWRQARGFALGMAVLALFGVGAVLVLRAIAWPLLTLAIGILCGVTTFADEQQTGAFRFASDQRLPLGRIWLVKTMIRFAVGIGAAAVICLGVALVLGVITATASGERQAAFTLELRSGMAAILLSEPYLFFFLWIVYGYAVGLLFGLLFRKPLVAGVVALGIAGPLTAVWVPSVFVFAGLSAWQVWGVPAVLLLAARALMHPRASERLVSSRSVAVISATGVAAVAWLAAALWYRAVEIPEAPDAIDVQAFEASLPTPEENVAGRLLATSLHRVAEIRRAFVGDELIRRGRRIAPGQPPPQTVIFNVYTERANRAIDTGWEARVIALPPGVPGLDRFLDWMFEHDWARDVARAAHEPTGIVFDPRTPPTVPIIADIFASRDVAALLITRGLQRQHEGDPAAFVDHLNSTLALARNMRQRTFVASVQQTPTLESYVVQGVDRWLERLDDRPDLLRRALAVLTRHYQSPPTDWEGIRKAEFLVSINKLSEPKILINVDNRNSPFALGAVESEDFLQFALQVPWEKVRVRRLLDAFASHDDGLQLLANRQAFPLVRNVAISVGRIAYLRTQFPTARERSAIPAALLKVALRLYQAENGRPAERLLDLVPKYIAAVPDDPYDGQPFRYRLSSGEELDWPPADFRDSNVAGVKRPVRKVAAGQGILWCVGDNKTDDGGHTQESPQLPGKIPGEDVIYLVPLPPGPM